MGFAAMVADLQAALRADMAQVRLMVRRDPGAGYRRITEIGSEVGARHGVRLVVNFPREGRILEFGMYGRRDLSVIMDMQRKRFPVDRGEVKAKAAELLAGCRTEDAYMYEDKERVKVFLAGPRGGGGAGRIDILPHSLHVWCELTGPVVEFCEWLFEAVYEMGGAREGRRAA